MQTAGYDFWTCVLVSEVVPVDASRYYKSAKIYMYDAYMYSANNFAGAACSMDVIVL